MQVVTVLGSTGSIGKSTLDVLSHHKDEYQVYALTANSNLELLIEQAKAHNPRVLVVAQQKSEARLREMVEGAGLSCDVIAGSEALVAVSQASEVNQVMAAIVGAAGLLPTLAAAKAGKRVLLANKEALVMSGQLLIDEANKSGAELLPIDSEHNAIFQCLPQQYTYGNIEECGIEKILLTGSGGPFLYYGLNRLEEVTVEQACNHPNWSMGRKISVDSATMMNKGLEFIEACRLFGVNASQIDVVIHPQSVIHSMVQYIDGSVLAQLGNPDMRTPIAHGLAYPNRIKAGVKPLNFKEVKDFTFQEPDFKRFPNLKIAIDACEAGQAATTCLNAANEIAVEAFLNKQIKFTDIKSVNDQVLQIANLQSVDDLEMILACDNEARVAARSIVKVLASC
jgi:1-deoxy-D-xylulose-5-phosphate reductoisomerase